jgi:GTPase SAR1 family protein
MAYPDTDVIILAFSVVRPDSFENILNKWIIELNRFIPNVLIILIGTQVDLRDNSRISINTQQQKQQKKLKSEQNDDESQALNDPKDRHISTKEGEELRNRIKACKYIECSALTQLNVKEVFDTCIHAYNNRTKKKSHHQYHHHASCFQYLFRSFRNSFLRRFRFHSSRRSSSSTTSAGISSTVIQTTAPNKTQNTRKNY